MAQLKDLIVAGDAQILGDLNANNFSGTDGTTAGKAGLVPAPATSDNNKYLKSDGTWATISTGSSSYTDLTNKPSINSVTLTGNKSLADLGITDTTYSAGTGISINSSNAISVSYGTSATTACVGNDSRLSDARTPTSHASSATTYGIGTTANYGHCMTINNLTTSAHADGKALSAYQGYVLNNGKQAKITYSTTDLTAGTSDLATGELYVVYE